MLRLIYSPFDMIRSCGIVFGAIRIDSISLLKMSFIIIIIIIIIILLLQSFLHNR